MPKHTPGPWMSDGPEVMADDYQKHIGTAWNNSLVEPDESIANAQLFAAAPDLLAACIAALHTLRSAHLEASEAWEQIVAAIAKTTGGP